MILDSNAWIEYLQGTEKGEKVDRILKSRKCFTSVVSISEITQWCLRNNKDYNARIKIVERFSKIIPLNKEIVILAGKVNFKHKKTIRNWGMLDSFIYSTALVYNLKVLTGDHHFSNLTNAEML